MADKTNNLTFFLKDIADTIREQDGSTELINPQSFSEKIRGLSSKLIKAGEGTNSIIGNDLETNTAFSENTTAFGTENTVGLKGYYWSSISFTDKTITLATAHSGGEPLTECGYTTGMPINIINDVKYDRCAVITAINGGVITVNSLPFTEVVDGDTDWDAYTVSSFAAPQVGLVDLGIGAFAAGGENQVKNAYGFAAGRQNNIIGEYGVALGRQNSVGYASFASGRSNTCLGQNGAMFGERNHGKGNKQFSFGYGNEHQENGYTYSFGSSNTMNNKLEYAFGRLNTLNGESNIALGTSNITSNYQVVSIGFGNNVDSTGTQDSDSALAIGSNINITNKHTVGLGRTIALSHCAASALGIGLTSTASYQTLLGAYNAMDGAMGEKTAIRITGAGTGTSNRKTVETLSKDGDLMIAGSLTLGPETYRIEGITSEVGESDHLAMSQAGAKANYFPLEVDQFYDRNDGGAYLYGNSYDNGPFKAGVSEDPYPESIPVSDANGRLHTINGINGYESDVSEATIDSEYAIDPYIIPNVDIVKRSLDKKLDLVTPTYPSLYGATKEGQRMYLINNKARTGYIPIYDNGGVLRTGEAFEDEHCVNLKQMQDYVPVKAGTPTNSLTNNDSNQLISEGAVAFGYSNVVGQKGYYWSEIDTTNKTITLATAHTGGEPVTCEYEVGDLLSIVINSVYYTNAIIISAINGSVITYDTNTTISSTSSSDSAYDSFVYCANKPTIGYTTIPGDYSYASGENNHAMLYGTALGSGNKVTGVGGTVFGLKCQANQYAFATGNQCIAGGRYSVAVGGRNTVGNTYAFCGGLDSTANGYVSFAWGNGARASDSGAVVFGTGTRSTENRQLVVGNYNALTTDASFMIGNGTSHTARSNSLEATVDGNLRLAGSSIKLNAFGSEPVEITADTISELKPIKHWTVFLEDSSGDNLASVDLWSTAVVDSSTTAVSALSTLWYGRIGTPTVTVIGNMYRKYIVYTPTLGGSGTLAYYTTYPFYEENIESVQFTKVTIQEISN